MIRAVLLAALVALAPSPALAQGIVRAEQSPQQIQQRIDAAQDAAISAAVAAISPQLCPPGNSMPRMESTAPSAGTASTCRRSDDVQPRITRAAVVSTDAAGVWSVTWATPLMAAPVVYPIPINATTQPIVCNVATRTVTAATGRCWLARTLPATLLSLTSLVTYDVFGSAATGISVQVLAIPPTQ